MKGEVLDIITNPNPILRKMSKELNIEDITSEKIKKLLLDMKETMLKKDGAGLAAPQIGKNLRIFVINHDGKNLFMINPKITKLSYGKIVQNEGCLSVLNEKGEIYYKPVSRHKWLNLSYYNEKAKLKKIKAKSNLARVIQHENDHLNGVLFIDHL